ncbi:pyridoxamine 5'-phosphate oxidase family protein [Lunatimonas salinarum]|uniref:pyridoxamine 5'-phosphate oxidase family protein n=1 Tax=Lunatimonas salinarum TaxID=1774590 RepID=UPI001ADEDFB9|nr:pyridoxamine 5'-phosphate oxidase family protein [Lunatimonas salinarum]
MLFDIHTSLDDVFQRVKGELREGALDANHPFRFFPLTTYGSESRYVVLRKFSENFIFSFFTDSRSSKVGQLMAKSQVALLFYDPGKRVQVRVKGKATVHHQDDTSALFWESIPREARKAYGPLIHPGHRIGHPSEAHIWPESIDDRFFTVVEVFADKLDVMQLSGFDHIRAGFEREGGDWRSYWLAP